MLDEQGASISDLHWWFIHSNIRIRRPTYDMNVSATVRDISELWGNVKSEIITNLNVLIILYKVIKCQVKLGKSSFEISISRINHLNIQVSKACVKFFSPYDRKRMKLPIFLFLVTVVFAGLWKTSKARSVRTRRSIFNNEVHMINATLKKCKFYICIQQSILM